MGDGPTARGDDDALLDIPVAALAARYGEALAAVVLYGSYLRGKRDTLLDFYVVLDEYRALGSGLACAANRALPPNVYHLTWRSGATLHAAKYATITLAQLERAVSRDFHSYFWARFAQPIRLLHTRDAAVAERLAAVARAAARRMLAATLPLMPERFDTTAIWSEALRRSYASELRAEAPARATDLARAYADHFATATALQAPALGLEATPDAQWRHAPSARARTRARRAWCVRRVQGKFLSVARLGKAAFTFNDPLDYVLWKIERHTGVRVEPTPRQRRHPLLFSWGLLWRVYRAGGFR